MRLLSALLLACCATTAAAVERAIPYEKLHDMFARVAALQGGTYLKASARLSTSDGSLEPGAIRLVVKSRNGDIAVPIDANGVAQFPLSDALADENPDVIVNVAEGKLSFSVDMAVEAPPVERFRYGLMVEMLDDYEKIVDAQGFTTRMMAPDFDGLLLVYERGTAATAVIESASGPKTYTADADGHILIPDERAWRDENPWVQLSAKPQRITLMPD